MTSDRRLAANRANAKRSTGPRTPAGKARASANARRHGLTAIAWSDVDTARIAELAAHYRPLLKDPDAATRAAGARVHLDRIITAKTHLLQLAIAKLTAEAPAAPPEDLEARALVECLVELNKLGQYERKARSRLKRALRTS